MGEGIAIAVISGVLTLAGTILTVWAGNTKTRQNLEISQAITNTKLDNLREEVQKHNNFAQRMPVVEEQIKVINHRLEDLENNKGA